MQVITDQVLAFSKDNAPCATAQPGEVLLFKTQDCFAGRIPNEDVTMKDLNFSYGFTNPAAGPVYIEGAEPGDVLVVDKIGKNISGDGMDPNVSGRFVQPKYCSGGIQAEKCVILDLTDETHGNAQGIGLAEVTTRRLFNKMKLEMTYPTGVTNTFLHLMKIPMIMDNDREALQLALMCCPEAEDHDHMKMIRIPNTAHIGVIEISEGMLPLVENNPNFEVLTEPYDLPFDENGNLF